VRRRLVRAHSPDLVYPDLDQAHAALFEAARWQTKLTFLAPPGRSFALCDERPTVRLWVLTPAYRTVWAAIEEAFARGDRAAAGRLAQHRPRCGGTSCAGAACRSPISTTSPSTIPARLLATPWTVQRDRLTAQLQRLFAAAVL